jgi:hypothetical protein
MIIIMIFPADRALAARPLVDGPLRSMMQQLEKSEPDTRLGSGAGPH